jgi:ParB family chromosome partitioning protein
MQSKKLGRGLGGLVGIRSDIVQVEMAPTQPSADQIGTVQVPLDLIVPSPFQPRKVLDDGSIARLAESIGRSGVMQPIIVRRRGDQYELIVGERRWRASRKAGLTTIPAIVRDLNDQDAAEWALVENVQREDLNPMERAWALRALTEKFGMTQAEVAQRVALDRTTVTNLIRLTEIEPEIATMIAKGELSPGHGKALLALPPGEARLGVAKAAHAGDWSVRRTERAVQEFPSQKIPPAVEAVLEQASGREAVLRDLERQVSQQLGTKVTIQADRGGKRGKLIIEFYGLDHFDGLLARMGIRAG